PPPSWSARDPAPLHAPPARTPLTVGPRFRKGPGQRRTSRLAHYTASMSQAPTFHVILFQPEIPPNTGNVIRLCANTGARLHLVEPLGFALEDKQLKRAGLDYHEYSRVQVHRDLDTALAHIAPRRLFALSTRASVRHDSVAFEDDDAFLFGPESRGLPQDLLDAL